MNFQTEPQTRWAKHRHWLLLMVSLLITSLITAAAPTTAFAETDEGKAIAPSSYLPTLHNNACRGTASADNPFGVQMYGWMGTNIDRFNALQNSNTSWVRNSIEWGVVEPTNRAPSQYAWGYADQVVRMARTNCVNMIITFDTTPEWATTGDARSPFKTENLPDFVEFVTAVVERYDGDGAGDNREGLVVKYWEFYNEPDAGSNPQGGGWGFNANRYAQMLQAVYPAVKAADPEAKVVFGGLAYDNFVTGPGTGIFARDFLPKVLEAGGGDYFDIINFHYYPFNSYRQNWTESQSSGLVGKAREILKILSNEGYTKELMITEMGWHSNSTANTPSSPEYQSRRVVQLFTQAAALNVVAAVWWPLTDSPTYPFNSGLTTQDHVTKPAYNVYIVASKRIGEATFVRTVVEPTANNDLEVYEFREAGTNKTMFIAWLNPVAPLDRQHLDTNFNDAATQQWRATGNTARIYNKEGALIQTIPDNADGADNNEVTITVGTDPRYIVID